ncbi:MAG: ATP-binding cassette domain-containing protein [Clostridia bacterium]|nr:ATP-binding cassette domain-containing protein [Clostridia bacterium]
MLLELKDITFERENKKILDRINLKLEIGKFIAITGPNGSGKSTLVKIIMGIERPDSGKIIFDGKDITDLNINERANLGIGFAFQQPVKFKGITVYDLLKIAGKKDMTKMEACEILSKVGLCAKEYVDREVNGSLSGGEIKRIEIATVALRKAKLTIFDEPEAGIDLWSFSNLIDVFEKMGELIKGTTLIISHQERILRIADEVILMKAGKIEKMGEGKEILNQTFAKTECYKMKGGKYERKDKSN